MLRQGRARTNGNGHAPRGARGAQPANGARRGRSIVLSEDERSLVLAACERYRQLIPVYLASSQPELQLICTVIRKLS